MTKPPFLFPPVEALRGLAGGLPPPPAWLQSELRSRLVLLLNHVLMQEPQAMDRLRRQQGKTVHAAWNGVDLWWQASAAGLLAVAAPSAEPDLRLRLTEASPWSLAQAVLAGRKPAVDIQGDVQLAAEVAWLVDNVRWDVEEDLARLLGDAAAHTLVGAARTLAGGLKGFAASAVDRAGAWKARTAPGAADGTAAP